MNIILSVFFAIFTFGVVLGVSIDPTTMQPALVGSYEKTIVVIMVLVGFVGSIHIAGN